MSVRVLVADDEELLRVAFTMILRAEPGMDVVGEAADGETAVRLARRLRPDVVLMDVRMPGTDGIEATRRTVREAPGTRVLVLTTFDLDAYAFEALRAGASGFLLKNTRPEELLTAIRDVARGDAALSPRVTRRLLQRFAHQLPVTTPGADERLHRLTPREHEILTALARGLTNGEIAMALDLAEPTVKRHIGHVLTKLHLRDRVQAVIFAYETGLVGRT
ncbi:response regulator [Streptomyces sp. NPDC101490]|uniref:response regulator n=1 Tax=Streptomyces sp. NPDC101490 TaxID=3366143 RepID=UPI0038030F26